MIGLRTGFATGPSVGPRVGLSESGAGTVIAGVTRDAASGIYTPASGLEWTVLLQAAGLPLNPPTNLWLLQEAAGSPADTIGTAVLGANAAPTYQSPSTGWTRKGIRFADGVASQRLLNNAGAPNPGTTSTMVLAYIEFPSVAPAAARGIITKTASTPRVALDTTGKLQLVDGGTADLLSTIVNGAVHPVLFSTNLTSSSSVVDTDQEEFVGTFATPASGSFIGFSGTTPAISAATNFLYAAEFSGVGAELTKAQRRTLLQTLGWTIPW